MRLTQRTLKVLLHGGSRGVSLLRVLRGALDHHIRQGGRYLWVDLYGRYHVLLYVLERYGDGVFARKGYRSRQHLVYHYGAGIYVAFCRHLFTLRLLRGDIMS